jgi:hypothetical protein
LCLKASFPPMATTDTPTKKSKNPLKSMVKRVGSFTKSASFSRSTKKMTKKDPAVEEAVRYALIVLPLMVANNSSKRWTGIKSPSPHRRE